MNQRGFTNIVVVIIAVLVLAAAGGYYAIKQGFWAENVGKTNKPVIDLKVSPSAVEKNGTFVLTWSTQNAVSCEASSPTTPDQPFKMNWSGPIELSGSKTYNKVPHDLLFELTCKNSAGDTTFVTASVTVKSEEVSNETTNWKTYRNEKYGYEFKYPENYKINVNTLKPQQDPFKNDVVTIISYAPPPDYYSPNQSQIMVTISTYRAYPKPVPSSEAPSIITEEPVSNITLGQWIEFKKAFFRLSGISNVTVGGETASRVSEEVVNMDVEGPYSSPYNENRKVGTVRLIHNGIGYEIKYAPSNTALVETFNKILSTFKFLK